MASKSESRRNLIADGVAVATMWTAAALIAGALGWILVDIAGRGLSQVSPQFLLTEPEDAGRSGGIFPMIVSTLLILTVTVAVSCPISLATSIALADVSAGRTVAAAIVRRSVDALAAVPSIVFGLFGNAFFCVLLDMGYSILAGGLTLACMALPIMIRTIEQALRTVPDDQRYGAAALGLSRTTTLLSVELPVAAPAMAAGIVLGIGRALAETAALLFTSGYVTRTPGSLLDSGRSLSVHIFDMAMNVPHGSGRAYATASILVCLLIVINGATMVLSRSASGDLRPEQATERLV